MENDGTGRSEIATVVKRLRWHLTELHLAGVKDWPVMAGQQPVAGSVEGEKRLDAGNSAQALSGIREDLGDCRRCRLCAGRTTIVFGEGSPRARLVFVGEGPGFEEDQQGRPFVGRAGKLLDRMLMALGFRREDVYICNVVKCRPPDNRTPLQDEIEACSPVLFRQIEAIAPAVICALGACAAQTMLATTKSISSLRGKRHSWRGMPLVCTFHPAYLLRNASQKASTWQDLIIVHETLTDHREVI